MKQYECDVYVRQRVIVEADTEQEARATAMVQHKAMSGTPTSAVQQDKVMEIVKPTVIFGRGAIV